jgi:hypothetical protein
MWDGDWDILVREKVRRRGGPKDPEKYARGHFYVTESFSISVRCKNIRKTIEQMCYWRNGGVCLCGKHGDVRMIGLVTLNQGLKF